MSLDALDLTLEQYADKETANKYCKAKNLKNESDVEQNFLVRLLDDLGFTEDYRESKETIKEYAVGKGKKKKAYRPDFICFSDKGHLRPVLVIDAKHPAKSAEEGIDDAQLYTSILRRFLDEPKPVQYCIGSKGFVTVVKHYDRDVEEYRLDFADFADGNAKFELFRSDMNRDARAKSLSLTSETFEFKKPETSEIRSIFEACHKIIWRREFESPVPAFWEFCKLMFIKLNEDKNLRKNPDLRKLIEAGKPLPRDKIVFSTHYIATHENGDHNPIASLFRNFRNDYETKILSKEKKRIFDADEEIELEPLTIRQVVMLLEHHDLIKIDDDLNGRLFQTFLSATMRGKQLGQYFTPRNVVEFMTQIAELQVTAKPPYAPFVLDACCGTGGFLIEAMANMTRQLKDSPLSKVLTPEVVKKIERAIKDDHLFGIDAGKNPPIARIARINMYLHGDGGSRIWFADALDKKVKIAETIEPEIRSEREELRKILLTQGKHFQVALTNPPFSMRKKSKEKDQHLLLQDYNCRTFLDKDGKTKTKTSLKSNVMFLERYHDLLEDGGTLLTVIDESVLNTDTDKPFRTWMLKHYYLKAVISLPQDTFVDAGSNVKTSILLLEKKATPSEEQPHTFYGRSEDVKGEEATGSNDLPVIRDAYFAYKQTGSVPGSVRTSWSDPYRYFIAHITPSFRRIDFEWLDPRHQDFEKKISEIKQAKSFELDTIADLVSKGVCKLINGKTAEVYVHEGIPIIKVRNVTNEGIDWKTDKVYSAFYDANASSHLQPDDILITSTGVGTIGRVSTVDKKVDCMTDGHVTAIRITEKTKLSTRFLVHYLRSAFGQIQMERYTVGSTGQTELNDPDIEQMVVLYPKTVEEQDALVGLAQKFEESALNSRKHYRQDLEKAKIEFMHALAD